MKSTCTCLAPWSIKIPILRQVARHTFWSIKKCIGITTKLPINCSIYICNASTLFRIVYLVYWTSSTNSFTCIIILTRWTRLTFTRSRIPIWRQVARYAVFAIKIRCFISTIYLASICQGIKSRVRRAGNTTMHTLIKKCAIRTSHALLIGIWPEIRICTWDAMAPCIMW